MEITKITGTADLVLDEADDFLTGVRGLSIIKTGVVVDNAPRTILVYLELDIPIEHG
ncbi:MAG: hypothetical protein KTR35_16890 [Gammaproteobacteria bacterium]|nr:hypothetical protein [Gammaproteobacteria bacterium]